MTVLSWATKYLPFALPILSLPVATVGVGFQALFFSDYNIGGFEGTDHILKDVQKDARN
jgi:hypothetical protein